MKLLHIDSSPLGTQSVSRELSRRTVAQWQDSHPGTVVEYLDLAADAPSHLNMDSLGFRLGLDADALTPAQKRENARTEQLLSQFLAADVVVVGAPMYNFSIPSQLKAWIDRVAQAGRTFKYTEQGPRGPGRRQDGDRRVHRAAAPTRPTRRWPSWTTRSPT